MSIALATDFKPYVDEQFTTESKLSLVTNKEFDWNGAHTVKIYKVGTSAMNDYGRTGAADGNFSRYGSIADLNADTEEFTIKKDRSFIFNVDKLDTDETKRKVQAAEALSRQNREVVIHEIDSYVYSVMAANAGTVAEAKALADSSIYGDILNASKALDDAMVPETGRVLLVTPDTYQMLKRSSEIVLNTDIGADMRIKGVVANLDGAVVVKIPAVRLPEKFGFMLCHPSATIAPVKLEDYNIHQNTIYSSGDVVTGRIAYDAFVLENKKKGIYYQPIA